MKILVGIGVTSPLSRETAQAIRRAVGNRPANVLLADKHAQLVGKSTDEIETNVVNAWLRLHAAGMNMNMVSVFRQSRITKLNVFSVEPQQKDRYLALMEADIRTFQPDVIICAHNQVKRVQTVLDRIGGLETVGILDFVADGVGLSLPVSNENREEIEIILQITEVTINSCLSHEAILKRIEKGGP